MEFTQEQMVEIEKIVEERTKGLYTEDELNRKVTSEVDRRVESGIRKGVETEKSKWEEEFKKKATLSAEELAKLKFEEELDKIRIKESEINRRTNTLNARELFTKAEIPEENYSKFMDLLITDDEESTTKNVSDFIEVFNTTKENITQNIKKELSNVPAPKGDGGQTHTKSNNMDFVDIANQGNIRLN